MSDKTYSAYGGDKIIDLENEQIAEAFSGGGGSGEFVITKSNGVYDKTPSEVMEAIKADKTIYVKDGSSYRYSVLYTKINKNYDTGVFDQPHLVYVSGLNSSDMYFTFLTGNAQTGTWSTQIGYSAKIYPPS